MTLDFQTLEQKEELIIAEIELQTGQTVPPLQEEWDRLFARAVAGLSKIFDKTVQIAFRDVFLSTTQDEKVLAEYERWTKSPRTQPTQALLNVTGTGTPSAVIGGGPSGISYVASNGQKYYFAADITVSAGGIVDENITARKAGAEGNLSLGELSITAQNANISDTLTIVSIVNPGEELEDLETWRNEMKRVAQRPVLSDNYSYYFSTARQVDDVAAGYPYVGVPGQLDLYIEATVSGAPNPGDRIPGAPILTAVLEFFDGTTDGTVRLPVELFGFIPDDAAVSRFRVFAVTETAFETRISGISPDTTENRTDIETAVDAYYAERRPFVKGVSIRNTSTLNNEGLTAVIQNVIEANGMDGFDGVEFSLASLWLPISSTYPLGQGELTTNTTVWP